MSIGERIKEARRRLGYTQQELADAVGLKKAAISGYETGIREPDALKINALSKALGVTGDWLLETEYAETLDEPKAETVSPDAMKIALDYDALDYRGKYAVRSVLDAETAYLRHGVRNSPLAPEIQRAIDSVLNPARRDGEAK